MKTDGRDASFSLSQKFGGNKKERNHSSTELGAVRFMKTQIAADVSSARLEPPFIKQNLSYMHIEN